MSIKINFNIKSNNDNFRYHNNLQKSILNSFSYDNIYEVVDNDKILNATGVSLIGYNANRIILPQGKDLIIKEILLTTTSRMNSVILYVNSDVVFLDVNRKYIRLIYTGGKWYIIE
jgi:hypothetical protein